MTFSAVKDYASYDMLLLVLGAFFISGVGLMSITFFLDDYWGDEGFRKYLKDGKREKINN